MHFDYEKESSVLATIILKPTTTINTRTASSLLTQAPPSSAPTRTNSNRTPTNNPRRSKPNFTNSKNWACGGKASGQGARGDYRGKAENYDPDYHKRLQANHINGQQQQLQAMMPPPYMYQANAGLPPLAPRGHFNHDQSVSNPIALNTEIVHQQEKSIFSQDVHFNASTDVINENRRFAKLFETINKNKVDCICIFPNNDIYVKLDDNRDTINRSTFCFNKVSTIYDLYDYSTMIVTYKKDDGLEMTPKTINTKLLVSIAPNF